VGVYAVSFVEEKVFVIQQPAGKVKIKEKACRSTPVGLVGG